MAAIAHWAGVLKTQADRRRGIWRQAVSAEAIGAERALLTSGLAVPLGGPVKRYQTLGTRWAAS